MMGLQLCTVHARACRIMQRKHRPVLRLSMLLHTFIHNLILKIHDLIYLFPYIHVFRTFFTGVLYCLEINTVTQAHKTIVTEVMIVQFSYGHESRFFLPARCKNIASLVDSDKIFYFDGDLLTEVKNSQILNGVIIGMSIICNGNGVECAS
jgi:hypothetical protein